MPVMVGAVVSVAALGLLTPSYRLDGERTVGRPPLTESLRGPSVNPHKDAMNTQFTHGKKMKLREVWILGQGPTA